MRLTWGGGISNAAPAPTLLINLVMDIFDFLVLGTGLYKYKGVVCIK